ncbi:MAG: hypothetical protein KDE55_06045 [Novosphingobium sp.]|nr:hypothetical protein [Novosphingobium sp.]
MSDTNPDEAARRVREAANRVVELEAELEASGDATTASDAVMKQREILHRWVDSVVGVVSTPGVGRVVLIHENGRESRIASSELPMLLSLPVSFDKASD